jgi:hypothetical protein
MRLVLYFMDMIFSMLQLPVGICDLDFGIVIDSVAERYLLLKQIEQLGLRHLRYQGGKIRLLVIQRHTTGEQITDFGGTMHRFLGLEKANPDLCARCKFVDKLAAYSATTYSLRRDNNNSVPFEISIKNGSGPSDSFCTKSDSKRSVFDVASGVNFPAG